MKVKIIYKMLGVSELTRTVDISTENDILKVVQSHCTDTTASIWKPGSNYTIPVVTSGQVELAMYSNSKGILETLVNYTEITEDMVVPAMVLIQSVAA